jgi:1-deoxy-D-xylulose-5-phosphate synthase
MAMGGLHPIVAVYATFLNRALDQVLMDSALHQAGVTFVLDRAGVTGDDGASHNGMWDMSMLQMIPTLRLAAPRDGVTLRQELREALDCSDAPTVVRYPKGALPEDIPALAREGGTDVLVRGEHDTVLVVAVGGLVGLGLDVVTIEDGVRVGGVGSTLAQAMRDANILTSVQNHGIPLAFLDQGKRAEVLIECGLTIDDIVATVVSNSSAVLQVPAQQSTPRAVDAS